MKGIPTLCFTAAVALLYMHQCVGLAIEDVEVRSATPTFKTLVDKVARLRKTIHGLAKQVRTQQLFMEERIRSDGNSGIKQVRVDRVGTDSLFTNSHISIGAAAIHDRSKHRDHLGMGEVIAVLNGVEFRTGLNEYQLIRPSSISKDWHTTEDIEYPPVPPEVLAAPNVTAQIAEMKEYFKAFHRQNPAIRDYKPYFKPVLCYMEGAWVLNDDNLEEPVSWRKQQQEIRYTTATGSADPNGKYEFMPTKIVGFDENTMQPIYAQWDYRILCHPINIDLPTEYFRQQNDLTPQEINRASIGKIRYTRAARYRLTDKRTQEFENFSTLDRIMQQIPGTDNLPDPLNEFPIHQSISSFEFSNHTLLNTGYYHRVYKTNATGAMGVKKVRRGFSDEFLFMAETTQEKVAPFDLEFCTSKSSCSTSATRFTYAIPLEIVYLTPLLNWNPYNLELWENSRIPSAGGRVGRNGPKTAFNGTSAYGHFYRTPAEFFETPRRDSKDPTDRYKSVVDVLDKSGALRRTTASGTRIILPYIKGVGQVRLRYPIYPVHEEGSTNWKEIAVLKKRVKEQTGAISENDYLARLAPATLKGFENHTHEFYLSQRYFDAIQKGFRVSVTTTLGRRHSHILDLYIHPRTRILSYEFCDNLKLCWDGHGPALEIVAAPGTDGAAA